MTKKPHVICIKKNKIYFLTMAANGNEDSHYLHELPTVV